MIKRAILPLAAALAVLGGASVVATGDQHHPDCPGLVKDLDAGDATPVAGDVWIKAGPDHHSAGHQEAGYIVPPSAREGHEPRRRLPRPNHHDHGGTAIIKYIAARVDGASLFVDRATFDLVYDANIFDFDTDDDVAPYQRALDDLVRAAIEFGTTHNVDAWLDNLTTHGDANYRAVALLRAAALLGSMR
jgi:hypothetical protein